MYQNPSNSRFPHEYKARYYKSYQLAPSISPIPENFISKRGNQCTRFNFDIPGIPQFSVLDFNFNLNTHILKVEENRFNENVIDALDMYCFENKDNPEALVKPIPTVDRLAQAQQAANKQMELDKMFSDPNSKSAKFINDSRFYQPPTNTQTPTASTQPKTPQDEVDKLFGFDELNKDE